MPPCNIEVEYHLTCVLNETCTTFLVTAQVPEVSTTDTGCEKSGVRESSRSLDSLSAGGNCVAAGATAAIAIAIASIRNDQKVKMLDFDQFQKVISYV